MSFSKENMKWLLGACFLSGIWKDPNNTNVIEKLTPLCYTDHAYYHERDDRFE